jgi:plastocyanin
MNSKLIPILVVTLLVIGGLFLFVGPSQAPIDQDIRGEDVINESEDALTDRANSPDDSGLASLYEITIEADNFNFVPKIIKVKEGDTVRITLNNLVGVHDLKIDELNVATEVLRPGERQVVEFVATRSGNYEYYCSVGTHRAMGMVGTLVVE